MKKNGKTVFVGLSGGVDSSVSAAILQKEGYDVTGVFIKTWHPDFLPCTWREDRLEAMRVASHLGIPFHTFDFEKEYKEAVADEMIREYRAGRTPNPDILCNSQIKFGAFLEKARVLGADFIATGHYTRKNTLHTKTQRTPKDQYEMLAGVDTEKDQSYFLWTLTQEKLSHILFPVGGMQKKDVRKLAHKFELPTAERKDSQGICFLGALDMHEFLKRFIDENEGDVVDEHGDVIGRHAGIFFTTLGQRHGFTITKKETARSPYYVIGKDLASNTLTVSHQQIARSREKNSLLLERVNWIREMPKKGKHYQVRFRYRQTLQDATIQFSKKARTEILFTKPQERFPPGQSVVVYDGKTCLGGGVIR